MIDYEFQYLYYGHPVQVKYRLSPSQEYRGGIAYKDFIIDAKSGCYSYIDDIVINNNSSLQEKENCIIELDWADINEVILHG